ncbi:unnamed protein product, partial [Bubo scandiacus]
MTHGKQQNATDPALVQMGVMQCLYYKKRDCCHFRSCDNTWIKQADTAMQTEGMAKQGEAVRQHPVKWCWTGL